MARKKIHQIVCSCKNENKRYGQKSKQMVNSNGCKCRIYNNLKKAPTDVDIKGISIGNAYKDTF